MLGVIFPFQDVMKAYMFNNGGRCSVWFEVAQRLRQECVHWPLLFFRLIAGILLVVQSWIH